MVADALFNLELIWNLSKMLKGVRFTLISLLSQHGKYKEKEVYGMILISKEEAKWLHSKGARYKDTLHKTIGVGKKVYMTEDRKWMKLLNQRRESQIIKSEK